MKEKRMDRIRELGRRYGIFKAAQFGIAGIVGFLVAEGIILGGLLMIYGGTNVPSIASSSPTLFALDVLAFLIGVSVGFFVNEKTTFKKSIANARGSTGTLARLAKYQGVYVVGNAITIGTQLALLAAFALSPALGVMLGAVVAYPVSYVISMRFVWKV